MKNEKWKIWVISAVVIIGAMAVGAGIGIGATVGSKPVDEPEEDNNEPAPESNANLSLANWEKAPSTTPSLVIYR